jgi:OOP family OmpA-OmpF porin
MSDSPLRIVPNPPTEPDQTENSTPPEVGDRDEMDELRRLLVGAEQTQINNILERLNNPRVRAREVSRLLSEAIRLRAAQDDSLTEALAPTVVTSFHNSVKKDPQPIADAISPVMGPAIRRSITNALAEMIKSFDQALKHSFSWQGFKWRIEALRTGKSFAEVVLYHTLLYRVEQVFLIDKRTSVCLLHVAAGSVAYQDPDIVSGMLAVMQEAIKNFAGDAFGSKPVETAEKLDLGDREVWFEPGPHAVLAAVIRGDAPEALRTEALAPAIEAIHLEQREALNSFDGDTAPFELSRPRLESCLESKYQSDQSPGESKLSPFFWVVAASILIALGILAFLAGRSYWRWETYVNRLRSEPGIVVTDSKWGFRRSSISGMRDPLAADPEAILRKETRVSPASVYGHWERFQSLRDDFTLPRAKALLAPPESVSLKMENGVLVATGQASNQWIADARRLAQALPGIAGFKGNDLVNSELEAAEKSVEAHTLRFENGTTQISPGQAPLLQQISSDIIKLIASAEASGKFARVQLIGHSSAEGTEDTNFKLSQDRAEKVLSLLGERGVSPASLGAVGVGSNQPVSAESSPDDRKLNRSVSFKVSLTDTPPRKAPSR